MNFGMTTMMAAMKKTASGISPLVSVERGADKPLHAQIYDALRAAIVDRSLRAGERIPSTRSLASELCVSRIPVLTAYAQLLAEGYFETRIGSGTFVSSSLPDPVTPAEGHRGKARRAPQTPRPIARRSQSIPPFRRPVWMRGQGAFSVAHTAADAFPFRAWSNLVRRYWRNLRLSALQYSDVMGLRALREAIASYLRASRSVRCEWQQIMIVSGSQQALDLSTRVLLDEGNPVWVEEPGYWLARHVLLSAGCRLVPVPVDSDGLDVATGIERCPRAHAVFTTPSHQFPLGATMSASRRLQLLEWAERAGAWIVEDDYDSEYRYDGNPIASLQGLDQSSRVVYIGTFSKVLFPSLRIGYFVVPSDLVDRFGAIRYAMDVCPPHQNQAVLAEFINEGHFSRHVRRMRQIYSERREVLVSFIQKELDSILEIHGANAGLHLAVTLTKGFRDRAISERAANQNLWLWPLSPAFIGPSRQGFILGFAGATAAEIPPSLRLLRSLLKSEQAAQARLNSSDE
jgi:GntR family transcriptional regulator / MocR family aminotransferase